MEESVGDGTSFIISNTSCYRTQRIVKDTDVTVATKKMGRLSGNAIIVVPSFATLESQKVTASIINTKYNMPTLSL